MAARKIKDVAVKTGEYTDRNTGQTKGCYANVGALMKNEDGSVFILLERWFNPAGIPGDATRSTVLLSCFDLREQSDQGGGSPQGGNGGGSRQPIDDDIPF